MPFTNDTQDFTALSARLTGFDEAALKATGLTELYRTTAAERLGPGRYARLLREDVADGPDGELRDAARAVTYLWYTGSWPGPPPVTVAPDGGSGALVWKAAGIAAPATEPGGYGSWSR